MIKHKRSYKIAMIGDCLSGGGAERVQALLSNYFDSCGIEVLHCIFVDQISYPHSGIVLNLGKLLPNAFAPIRKARRFMELRKFIQNNNFDFVIDFRMRTSGFQELLISAIYPKGTIYTVHSSILEYYFPKPDSISKRIYKNHKIVAVSEAIKAEVEARKLATNVTRIYNPVAQIRDDKNSKDFDFEYILAVGRMNDAIKQFDKLIDAYSKSVLPSKGIKLMILGEGENKVKFEKLATTLNVSDSVVFHDFVSNPFPFYKNALFQVLSSKREGLPMVLIEALSAGTPVVSFDCVSGPREIIIDCENGLLVADQDFEALRHAMDKFVSDTDLYNKCKAKAQQSAAKFSLETIGRQWLDYLKIDVS